MFLTKDETRILAAALAIAKYEFDVRGNVFDKLNELEERLYEAGKDKRRIGRKSQNNLADCLKRYAQQ